MTTEKKEELCMCKDRPANECPGEWEPGCDLGNNEKYVKVVSSPTIEKRAPVQGYSAGIPWEMHLRAYDVYCKKYGPQQALIEGWCRGGFDVRELDEFIPGWRDELRK